MRKLTVAGAQMGPIQKAETRQAVVARMLALMDEAKAKGADLIVYPELALTTFFPRWHMTDQSEVDAWFEREMPNAATRPLFERAARHEMAMSFGYAELDAGRPSFQHRDPHRQARPHHRQIPQGPSAGTCGIRSANAASSISRSAISSRGTSAFRSGARSAA